MRASRLVTLLLLLQTRGQLTARELAERLEVSERTVQRDVEALLESGVPVRSTRGVGGGYRLDGGYRTRLTGLSAREAEALVFLGLTGPASSLGLRADLEDARLKVLAALPAQARERAERASQLFHLDTDRWFGRCEPTPLLPELAAAVWAERRVTIGYTSSRDAREGGAGDEGAERVVDPHGLVLKGEWYLVASRAGAASGEGPQPRTYRVSRVSRVVVLDEPAVHPPGFDLAAHWRGHERAMESHGELVEVCLRVHPRALPALRRGVTATCADALPVLAGGLPVLPDGRVEVRAVFDGVRWATTCLLGLGADAEVVAPAAVRAGVAAAVAAMAALYAEDGANPSGKATGADGLGL